MQPYALEIDQVSRTFGRVVALDSVSLAVPRGETMCILGHSGSGKTTLLEIVAGIREATRGTIRINGVDITRVEPQHRGIGMVFQSPEAIFPHLTVFENVAFPLRVRRHRNSGRNLTEAVNEILNVVNLIGWKDRFPAELSGGMRQRVALARALVYQPAIILLDEPLSSLDTEFKEEFLTMLIQLREHRAITILYVTHDEREAFEVAHHIAVLEKGRLVQTGTVKNVVEAPVSASVAHFGSKWNVLRIRVEHDSAEQQVVIAACRIVYPSEVPATAQFMGFPVDLVRIRSPTDPVPPGDVSLEGKLWRVFFDGTRTVAQISCGGQIIRANVETAVPEVGNAVRLDVGTEQLRFWS